jgi:MFS family permease
MGGPERRETTPPEAPSGPRRPAALPRAIWALGLTSMFMDVSSEMIHSLLPVFLVSVLGASAVTVGLIEGVAEATTSLTKIVSGTLSDRLGRRKRLAMLGYGMAAASKPFFALAGTAGWVLAARFADRVGKGIRGAPRDALVGDLAPPGRRGAAYGLRQSLDTVGAFLGPLLAIALMMASGDDFRLVFWAAVPPGGLAVLVLALGVEEKAASREAPAAPPRRARRARLGAAYWQVTAIASLFALARFSEAFLVLRASDAGLGTALVPLVLIVMNVVYALSAYPAGRLSDALGRWGLAAAGMAVLVLADLLLALASGLAGVMIGIALWGLHMGLSQGIFAALVADTAPPALRGTAFGVFNLATGLASLTASLGAGALWQGSGPAATFLAGAALAALAGLGIALLRAARSGA